jgi:hypothetical protein
VHVGLAMRVAPTGLIVGLGLFPLMLLGVLALVVLGVVALFVFLRVLALALTGIGAGMLIAMLVPLPHAAFASRKQGQAGRPPQLDDLGVACQRAQRLQEESLHRFADPEHHFGLLESTCFRRPEAVAVLGTGALDQQDRLPDGLHHAGHQRVHRLDAGHHVDLCRRARRYYRRSACVARLNPVEREQRLLAIREGVADHPAAWGFLTAAIEADRAGQSNP